MNHHEAFLAAICAEPENHALKMIYADWLEEQGDERAEAWRWLGRWKISPIELHPIVSDRFHFRGLRFPFDVRGGYPSDLDSYFRSSREAYRCALKYLLRAVRRGWQPDWPEPARQPQESR